tara:strand:+ start:1770 stop:2000 length:231 start_codon:yes stop_codon:yes gene_type:complete
MDENEVKKAINILEEYYKKFPEAMDIDEIETLFNLDREVILLMMLEAFKKNKYLDIKYPDLDDNIYDGGEIILRDG